MGKKKKPDSLQGIPDLLILRVLRHGLVNG
jgi:hypothetical protein